jgi:hypothetical protein
MLAEALLEAYLLTDELCSCRVLQGTAFADDTAEAHAVPHGGDYHFRANPGAEKHLNDPAAVAALQAAAQVSTLCLALAVAVLAVCRRD